MIKIIKFYWKYPTYLLWNVFFRIRSKFIIERYDLIVIDDIFPHKISAWRYEEFTSYLKYFKKHVCIFTTGNSLGALHDTNNIRKHIIKYRIQNPTSKRQLKQFQHHRKIKAKLGYVIFLNNAYSHLDFFERNRIPFIFTLYPGAGFLLGQESTDKMLKKVMASPFFRGVITTQKITYEYINEKGFCETAKIHFVYGVVAPNLFLNQSNTIAKSFFKNGIFNIAFVANKQMPQGKDKGYDVFIEAAIRILKSNKNVFFHIVGPFSKDDIDVKTLKGNIIFHGFKTTNEFPLFYKDIDIIVSPNKPYMVKPGAFDGFPTGACTEASLNGVAMMVTDPLYQNIHFTDGKDIVIIQPDPVNIAERLLYFYNNNDKLKEIALKGQIKCNEIYSYQNQILPRIDLLEKSIN